MSLPTFAPPKSPSYGSAKTVQPRILETPFGDGYRQTAGDGLNTQVEAWDLTWTVLKPADADTIEAFFVARDGREPFWWTPLRQASPKKFRCTKWSRTVVDGKGDRIAATLVQDFTLGS